VFGEKRRNDDLMWQLLRWVSVNVLNVNGEVNVCCAQGEDNEAAVLPTAA